MLATSTEVKNSFGRYLRICRKEHVIITKNGKKEALLLNYPDGTDVTETGERAFSYHGQKKSNGFVTYQQFMEMSARSDNRLELIDGIVYVMASPSFQHQKITGQLFLSFSESLRTLKNCRPFLFPFDIRLRRHDEATSAETHVVQPDLMVLCDYEKDITQEGQYEGTPTLVVEILSPTSRSRDQIKKLDLYMESGMKEFWIIDPDNELISVYEFEKRDLSDYKVYMKGQVARSVVFDEVLVDAQELFS